MDVDPSIARSLEIVVDRLESQACIWAVTGSLGQALQGLSVRPHDIDLQTDRKGAYDIEEALTDFLIREVTFSAADRIRSYLGAFRVEGIIVEVMGDVEKRTADGSWESVDLTKHLVWVPAFERSIPVVSLEYEQYAYARLGRAERADQIRQHLRGRDPSG